MKESSPMGVVSFPSPEDLMPNERERELLKQLWDWQEQSAKSTIILGVPMEKQADAARARSQR